MSRPPASSAYSDGVNIASMNGRRFATFRAVSALILREMATRYGRSPGGYLWAILEPLGAILILAMGMSVIVRIPPMGNSFILFFATAFLPFSLYLNVSGMVARSINFSRALLFYPAVTWVDAVLARFLLNTLTGVLVMLILFSGLFIATDISAIPNITPILQAVILAALLGLSVGIVNCVLFGLFPVWEQIWSIATRPLFLISGVFFLYEDLPTTVQNILWYNPVIHITGLMRQGFYTTYTADYVTVSFVAIVSLILLFFGVLLMGRFHRDILNS